MIWSQKTFLHKILHLLVLLDFIRACLMQKLCQSTHMDSAGIIAYVFTFFSASGKSFEIFRGA